MNSIEEITTKEKKISYVQRDKELFSFYTLTLIAQEQASKDKNKTVDFIVVIDCIYLFVSLTY